MIDVDLKSSNQQAPEEDVDSIVGESEQMHSIRTTIQEKGMDPIWVHLIKRFGSVMYLKGLESALLPRDVRMRRSA
jgi:hypothetical protein